jgi:hypothetical protein
MEHSPEEAQKLKILQELLKDLCVAINSLDEKAPPPESAAAAYMQYVAVAINRAADGFLVLRLAHRVAASKLLIRPALEALIAGAAIANQPDLLSRKARSEWEEEIRMFPKCPERDAAFQKLWADFEQAVRRHKPGCQINPTPISTRDMAKEVGWEEIYDKVYRLYCKFTHGAVRAVRGELDDSTDNRDTEIIIWCVFQALVLLKSKTPAIVPDLDRLHDRLPHGSKVSS